MRILRSVLACGLVSLLALGCGNNGFMNAKGHILKGGKPFLVSEGQGLRIFFAPTDRSGTRYDSYAASYDPEDGSFVVIGKDGRGLPPGNYLVGFQLMEKKEDLLGGKLLGPKSGITVDVTSSSQDLVIDLDNTPFAKAFEATTRKAALAAQSTRQRMPTR
jgi:hypothetical protein